MGKKYIEIRLNPDGSIQAETHGIKGRKCLDYMEIISEMLKAQVVDSDFTEEYYQNEEIEQLQINVEDQA